MPDLIFHIGLHKTGTTTLQNQFFPKCHGLNSIVGHARHVRQFLLMVNRTDPAYFDPKAAMSVLSGYLKQDQINLVSAEDFSWVAWSSATALGLDFRTQILTNLREAVPNARIILVLRRQDSLVRSLYRQYLQAGGTKPIDKVFGVSPNELRTIVPRNYFRFSPYVRRLHELFPAGVLVLAFEEFVRDKTVFLDKLAAFIGVKSPVVELKKSNSSKFGSFGLEMTRWLNHLFRTPLNPAGPLPGLPVKRSGVYTRITPTWWLHDHWSIQGKLSQSSHLYRRSLEILDQVRDDNRELDKTYGLGLCDYGYC